MQNSDHYISSDYIKNSKRGYDSTMAPFFRPYQEDNIDDIISESIIPDTYETNIDIIDNFSKLCDDKNIQDFYINNNGIDREIYINYWTFFSIEKIISLNEYYKNSNIDNIIDLGYIYHGMGWIVVAFYYLPLKKIYFRMDGGSSSYDRLENFNALKNMDENMLKNKNNQLGINFDLFLDKVKNNFNIPDDIM